MEFPAVTAETEISVAISKIKEYTADPAGRLVSGVRVYMLQNRKRTPKSLRFSIQSDIPHFCEKNKTLKIRDKIEKNPLYLRALKNFHFFLSGSFSFRLFSILCLEKSQKKPWFTP